MKYLLGVVLILTSCTVNKDLTTVKYSPTQAHPDYYLDVPKGYEFKGYEVTIEKERRYVYNDSSFVYITNFMNTPNYENIKSLGDSVLQLRFQNEELTKQVNELLGKNQVTVLPDTFELSGMNSKSLFWKDIKIGKVSIGYDNVPKEKKELFDKSLKTLKMK
ncbi:MAG: hypothetical protein K0B37_17445 [Bacteroidales bacterium]|nr:hypothetical protein [Bacteroidales bacterium]